MLTRARLTLPTSLPVAENPLPKFRWQQPTSHQSTAPVGLSKEELEGYTYMGDLSIFPYREQDRYSRELKPHVHDCLILENDHLKVTVLPRLGGRIYSMIDLSAGRELLFRNPVIRVANLALRNAWFSGGIEWNGGGIPGHSVDTCAPVFCHRIATERGPILRLHEFDRITETAWQVDLFLPADARKLYVHGRIVNPNDDARAVYWWTNATVPHKPGLRILAPADYAVEHVLPDNHLESYRFPDQWGFDGSFPDNWQSSTSVFFRRPDQQALPWLAACQPDGVGLGQKSTKTLAGRKFFYFGYGDGGQHWMEFLSTAEDGGRYIEVQSGLMPTQNQRHHLAAGSDIEWTECFFPLENCADVTDGLYPQAEDKASALFNAALSDDLLLATDGFLQVVAQMDPTETLAAGSPWGARHEQLSGRQIAPGLSFANDTAGDVWDAVATGAFVDLDAAHKTAEFVSSNIWRARLEADVQQSGDTWFNQLHLGMIVLDREDHALAARHLTASLGLRSGWLALRCMAVLHARTGDNVAATKAYSDTLAFDNLPPEVAVEYAEFLHKTDQVNALGALLDQLPDGMLAFERIRILRALFALKNKDFDALEDLLDYEFLTIREGEKVLSELWSGLVIGRAEHAAGRALSADETKAALNAHPIPFRLDFVMLCEERIAQK